MAVKLIDVARAAKVSRSTASNVFSNPERVKPKLREQVETAAKALGYAGPDPKARSLRVGKVNSIGVVVPGQWGVAETLRSWVFVEFLRGVARACDEAGANVVLLPDVPGGRGVDSALVDGFIFGRLEQMEQLEAVHRRRLPFSVVDFNAGPDVNSVMIDARAGTKEIMQHLLGLGHRRFGIISFLRHAGPPLLYPPAPDRDLASVGIAIDQEKLAGATEALAEAGLNIDDVPVLFAEPWDKAAAKLLLDAAPDVTAIFCMAIMQAIAVANEAKSRGINVPGDLSVAGYNDMPEAALCDPPITTLDTHAEEKGRIAAKLVLAGSQSQQQILRPQLIIRRSTGTAPSH